MGPSYEVLASQKCGSKCQVLIRKIGWHVRIFAAVRTKHPNRVQKQRGKKEKPITFDWRRTAKKEDSSISSSLRQAHTHEISSDIHRRHFHRDIFCARSSYFRSALFTARIQASIRKDCNSRASLKIPEPCRTDRRQPFQKRHPK